jgi:RNA polymerase-binding transcription factor DksA
MDAREPIRNQTGASQGAVGAGRWRLILGRRWWRRLDEVIALRTASEGASAAGNDTLPGAATLPQQQLRAQADAAHDELGDLADPITKIDRGSYRSCDECGQPMTDDWITRNPGTRRCQTCLVGTMPEPAVPRPRTGGLRLTVPRQRAG